VRSRCCRNPPATAVRFHQSPSPLKRSDCSIRRRHSSPVSARATVQFPRDRCFTDRGHRLIMHGVYLYIWCSKTFSPQQMRTSRRAERDQAFPSWRFHVDGSEAISQIRFLRCCRLERGCKRCVRVAKFRLFFARLEKVAASGCCTVHADLRNRKETFNLDPSSTRADYTPPRLRFGFGHDGWRQRILSIYRVECWLHADWLDSSSFT
jgi:hypothetical protein